ncbi:MAG: flavin reductase family protein [Caulobacteraceae bacterium]|jgi:flavin reductase (DIM6/NTAB) family NADH-FMN oxidoreductase RutF|nr:flavin reductase family protein [Caulobacteraceae bacterium]
MFYDALKGDHGLPHDPINALVSPRPIGWISSLSKSGVRNLAPYSYFNLVAGMPPIVMFGSAFVKDSQRNIEETGEFVCNLATWELREAVNASSAPAPPEVDEFALVGLDGAPSTLVRPPRIKQAVAALECTYLQTIPLPSATAEPHFFSMVLGLVVGVYIDEAVITDGLVDVTRIKPLSRLGYMDFAVVQEVFAMERPSYPRTAVQVAPQPAAT